MSVSSGLLVDWHYVDELARDLAHVEYRGDLEAAGIAAHEVQRANKRAIASAVNRELHGL